MEAETYRTEIVLGADQYHALAEIAARKGRSVPEVARDLIEQQLKDQQTEVDANVPDKLAALHRIRQHRDAILARRGGEPLDLEPAALINWMREERDAEILGSVQDTGS
ncbi:MAG TPA: hypothetical protein VM536_09795 [Chloroflexia bacterium]|nr:hypothetical protein [Chloroflexia bacterium]